VTSTDGITWIPSAAVGATNLSIVTYGQGLFVGAGLRGTVQTSTNGEAWTPRQTSTTRTLLGITSGNGRFVIVGNAGIILTSDDAVTWTIVNSGLPDILRGVTFGGGTFVAVGDASVATGYSTILTSPDGVVWSNRTPTSVQNLRGAAYGPGSFVLVGEYATILQSSSTEASLTANGFAPVGFELGIVGGTDNIYRLQVSTNLDGTAWTDLVRFTNTPPAMSLTDTAAMSFPHRYYRLVSP
jgi:hypothetical protein